MSLVSPARRAQIILIPLVLGAVLSGVLSYHVALPLLQIAGINASAPLKDQSGGWLAVMLFLVGFCLVFLLLYVVGAIAMVHLLIEPSARSWSRSIRSVRLARFPAEFAGNS